MNDPVGATLSVLVCLAVSGCSSRNHPMPRSRGAGASMGTQHQELPPRSQRKTLERSAGIDFVWVPNGRFRMGHPSYPLAHPVHPVELDGFWMSRYEIT